MVVSVLNSSTVENRDRFAEDFASATPFKHIVIDDFLDPDFCGKLLDEFPSFDRENALNENNEVGRKAVVPKITRLGPVYRQLDEVVKSGEFLGFIGKLTGINNLLYDPDYFGGGTHENLEGQDLDPHVDFTFHPLLKAHRRINLIVYLNREWEKEWGGNIEIHKDPRLEPELDEIKSFEPLFNRAVIFETHNHSWHGFPRISLPDDKKGITRKSIALYFYTREREEKIKPHSTIYVERHLPARYRPGMELTGGDIAEIKTLLARRDQHLKRLYGNITNLMAEVDDLRSRVELLHGDMSLKDEEAAGSDLQTRLLKQRIHDLEHSTSWKITAPFRGIARLIRGK